MTTNQNTTNNGDTQDVDAKLNDLLDKANKIKQEVDETNKESRENIGGIILEVDKSIANINSACSDMDEAKKKAGDELDAVILKQAEDLV